MDLRVTLVLGFALMAQSNVLVCADDNSEPLQLENISPNGTDSQSIYKDQVDFITAYLKNYYVYQPTSKRSLDFDSSTDNSSSFSNSSDEIILFLKSGNISDIIKQNTSMVTNTTKYNSVVVGVNINESLVSSNLSSNSLPLFYALAIDTLPVHPRIPRTPSKRRKPYQNNRKYQQQRRHRHSTRVILTKPAKFLLPPSANKIKDVTDAGVYTPSDFPKSSPYTLSTFQQQTSTTETNYKTTDRGSRRTIFSPPPKRYLLPPFVDNNNIISYSTTTVAYFESSTEYTGSYYDTLPTTKQYKQQTSHDKGEKNFNQNAEFQFDNNITNPESSFEQKKDDISLTTYDWNVTENYPKEFLQNRSEYYSSYNPEILTTINNENQWNLTSPAILTTENYPSVYTETKSENYVTVSTVKYDNYWNSTVFRPKSKKSNFNNQHWELAVTQAPFQQYTPTTTTSFPVITGRNVEQELFETGEFPAFVTEEETVPGTTPSFQDSHLSMMNKPLLSNDVASMGMKIVANVPSTRLSENKTDSVENLARGRQRFNHLNQFKFQNSNKDNNNKFIPRRKETSSKQPTHNRGLSVAETNYYRKRKISSQPRSQRNEGEIRVIPGVAGKDYPTLSKPPLTTSFSCKKYGNGHGYYADPSTGCQVFYICTGDGPGEPMLCPNGTLFSQDFLVCDWWYNIDCHA